MRILSLYVFVASVLVSQSGWAQIKKQFSIESASNYEVMEVKFHAQTGVCYFKPTYKKTPLNVYSNLADDEFKHQYTKKVEAGVCQVDLAIKSEEEKGFGKSISMGFLGNTDKEADGLWKVYLSQELKYRLDLKFDISDAFVDLSGINVESLKINSGSANVILDYNSGIGNAAQMEDFKIKVNLGSVEVNKMELTKAKKLNAEIGFGDLVIHYEKIPTQKSEINATVGAGNMVITMPKSGVPVIIKVKDSMFCSANLPKGYRELRSNVYVNKEYSPEKKNLQVINVDLAMGNMIIKEH